MKDEDLENDADGWFADRFARLSRVDVPDVRHQIPPWNATRSRRRGVALAAAACLVVVFGAAVAWWLSTNEGGDVEVGPVGTPGPSTTEPLAPSTTTPVPSELGLLTVSEFQTECCYIEGSTGVLEVRDAAGERVGALVESGELVQVPNDTGGIGFVSPFPDTTLPPGPYRVAVWQVDWPGTLDDADRMAQMDLCSADIDIAAGQVIELVATWAPGTGCVSFEAPDPAVPPPTTVTCGKASLNRVSSLFAADTALLGPDEVAALDSVRRAAPEFVEYYEWSVVKRVPGEVVLLGTVREYTPGASYMAYARVATETEWGSCELQAEADGFTSAAFRWSAQQPTEPADLVLEAFVCSTGTRRVPVVVETPHIVAAALLVELVDEEAIDCGLIDTVFQAEVDLAGPVGVRPLIDAGVADGQQVDQDD